MSQADSFFVFLHSSFLSLNVHGTFTPLSILFGHRFNVKQDVGCYFADNSLSCLSSLNQLLCILFLCKYHFMQEGILLFLSDMFLHCQMQHAKWNSRDVLLEFFLFCVDIVAGSSMMSK